MSTFLAIMIGIGIAVENRLGVRAAVAALVGNLLQEDGASFFLLENGVDKIKLEG